VILAMNVKIMAYLPSGLKINTLTAKTFFSLWHFSYFLNTFQMGKTPSISIKLEATSYKMSWGIEERGPVHG
jgi:hypothetical protein